MRTRRLKLSNGQELCCRPVPDQAEINASGLVHSVFADGGPLRPVPGHFHIHSRETSFSDTGVASMHSTCKANSLTP